MKRSRVSRLIACFLANVMAIVVFSSTAIAEHILSDRAGKYNISSGGGYPSFTKELIIDPFFDVQDGEEQYLSIWAQDPAGIAEVTATVKLNEGDRLIELQLAEGTKEEGRWEGTWIIENVSSNPKCKTEYRAVSESGEEKIAPISSWYPFPNQPPEIVQFQSPSQGLVNETLTFSATVVDPEADQVSVRFEWGDGSSQWLEYQPSGSVFEMTHSWAYQGTFSVRVQAKDSSETESEWSEPITVSITEIVVPPNLPPENPQLQGPSQGLANETLTFSATVVDPEADQVSVRFKRTTLYSEISPTFEESEWSEYKTSGSVFEMPYSWDLPGEYQIWARARDSSQQESGWTDLLMVSIADSSPPDQPPVNLPPIVSQFSGLNQGLVNQVLTFGVKIVDPQTDQVSVRFNWDNGQYSEWSEYQPSESVFEIFHSWSNPGIYSVQAKAKDFSEAESEWSEPITVTITENTTPANLPPTVSQVQGFIQGYVGDELTFSVTANDPEDSAVFVRFKTDYLSPFDSKPMSQISSWLGPESSGSVFEIVHCWNIAVVFHISAQAKDSSETESEWSEPITVSITEIVVPPNLPPEAPQVKVRGLSQILVNQILDFTAKVIDPEANQVCVRFGWDNGQDSEFLTDWSEYQPSGSVFTVSHSWTNSGTFTVQVQTKDSLGNLGDWSSPVTIEVSDSIVNVDSGSEIPRTFVLFQNYPNPFNPITEIAFSLPEDSHVTLVVFNSLGQQIAILVDESRGAGQHRVSWDGAGFTNGVYFYRLSAKGFAETRKMLLLK